jgi:hypothetical protein
MKRILIIAAILLAINVCISQTTYKMPVINGISFPEFLEKNLRDKFDTNLDTLGIDGLSWIKFKILPNGSFEQLEISPNTNQALLILLKEIMLKSNGQWTFRKENEWFIIPLKYTLQKNGNTKTVFINPYDMNAFFSDNLNAQTIYTFLPLQEYVSPFDRGINSKLKIKN